MSEGPDLINRLGAVLLLLASDETHPDDRPLLEMLAEADAEQLAATVGRDAGDPFLADRLRDLAGNREWDLLVTATVDAADELKAATHPV